ncbi:sialic acid-binding Ig-like lectin 11 [Scyliorhinus canicula]|uniref:sialic acid-binding Ig-like lectin 11 n=1 Tax=Scyliorhinus canicula TaxID=7830 RepID=UPI0018F58DDC|nr:sialic acid-binding Ig-like lectin 11 [Scyliorhinus canicula]
MSDNNYTCTVKIPNVYPPLERKGQGTRLHVDDGPELVIHYRTSDSDVFLPLLKNFIYAEHQSFLELNCTADSNPAPTVIWLKKYWARHGGIQLVAGVSSLILKKMNVDHSDSGDYICRAHNAYDSKESAVKISLTSDFGSKCQRERLFFYEFLV